MELLNSLLNLILAIAEVLSALAVTVAPLWPLIAWVAFWTLAVDWVKLRRCLLDGGWIGLVLTGLVMILIWGCVSPTETEEILGLNVSNFVAKTVWVTGLGVIMLLCGSLQLSGFCDRYLPQQQEAAPEPAHH